MSSNILIVEDQTAMREQLRDFVQSAYPGASVAVAADGAAALAACDIQAPDLIVMDICLPDIDGIALTARILSRLPRTRVIVVSHHAVHAYRAHAMAAGAFGYVPKHAIAEELLPLIERALGPGQERPS